MKRYISINDLIEMVEKFEDSPIHNLYKQEIRQYLFNFK